MLVTALINIFNTLMRTILLAFPVITLPSELTTGLTFLIKELYRFNRYFPIKEIFLCVVIYLGLVGCLYSYYVASRAYKEIKSWIPFI